MAHITPSVCISVTIYDIGRPIILYAVYKSPNAKQANRTMTMAYNSLNIKRLYFLAHPNSQSISEFQKKWKTFTIQWISLLLSIQLT